MLQVARFLLKSLTALLKGKNIEESVSYLKLLTEGNLSVEIRDPNQLNCPFLIRKILSMQACAKVKEMGEKIQKGVSQKLSQKEVWDHYAGIVLVDAAISHSYLIMYNFFLEAAMKVQDESTKAMLINLLTLYGLEKIN